MPRCLQTKPVLTEVRAINMASETLINYESSCSRTTQTHFNVYTDDLTRASSRVFSGWSVASASGQLGETCEVEAEHGHWLELVTRKVATSRS